MGKRQIRIFNKDLKQHLPELFRQASVQVVLSSKVVLHGSLSGLNNGMLQLQDFRFGKHEFDIEQVEEVIYDIEAAF